MYVFFCCRPSSVTWDVRCSPSKAKQTSFVNFLEETEQQQTNSSNSSLQCSPTSAGLSSLPIHCTWADKVKGTLSPPEHPINSPPSEHNETPTASPSPLTWNEILEEYTQLKTVSWADRSESPPSPQCRETRSPGRCVERRC